MRHILSFCCLNFVLKRYSLKTYVSLMTSAIENVTTYQGIHEKCRNATYAKSEISRFQVPDDKVRWSAVWNDYNPVEYTDPHVLKANWADPEIGKPGFSPKFNELDGKIDRKSFMGKYELKNGRPQNPIGRTGMTGRGKLGRWGPNHAADPIVTRWKRAEGQSNEVIRHPSSNKPQLQFVAILRRDVRQWAFPGGMVDPGEMVSATLKREFGEEAFSSLTATDEDEKKRILAEIDQLFNSGLKIYHGYVDDPRNTDNAWMETVAMNFHDDRNTSAAKVQLKAGDDAADVLWTDISSELDMYASHKQILRSVALAHNAHW